MYIGQTKTILGVIFHYAGKNKKVSSIYYTNKELKQLGQV